MASGLLLLCLGRATKLTQFLTGWDKRYLAEVTLGKTSNTLDADGTIVDAGKVPEIDREELTAIMTKYVGRISQRVPAYSAVKRRGRRLYKLARSGEPIRTPERTVEIQALDLVSMDLPRFVIDVRCSKGTYIRALAADIGEAIGCGGYLSSLQRLAVGPVVLDAALTIDEVRECHESGNLNSAIISSEDIVDFPKIRFRERAREAIRHGRIPSGDDILSWNGEFSSGELLSFVDESGSIMAIARSNCEKGTAREQGDRNFFSYVRVLI
jgi:tRNA pseudouridine55 synthase